MQPYKFTYSEFVFVDLGTQGEIRMRYIVICGLSGPTMFLHIISQAASFLSNISHSKKNSAKFLW